MYKGNKRILYKKLLIFINMIILPVIIVLAWHFATSTGANVHTDPAQDQYRP